MQEYFLFIFFCQCGNYTVVVGHRRAKGWMTAAVAAAVAAAVVEDYPREQYL